MLIYASVDKARRHASSYYKSTPKARRIITVAPPPMRARCAMNTQRTLTVMKKRVTTYLQGTLGSLGMSD